MFRKLTSGVALLTALCMTLSGLVFSPVHADVPVPADGLYSCETGGLESTGNTYQINNGLVIDGGSCAGAVVIPAGVTGIGDKAFRNANALTSITIPSSVTSIDEDAFRNATALTSIAIPSSVTSIGSYAFASATALNSITFAEDSQLTSIGRSAFYGTSSLTSFTIPQGVTTISDSLFYGATALTSITIPSGVESIGNVVFDNTTSLTSISVSANNQSFTSVDGVLFNVNATELLKYPTGMSGTSYSIPSSVTSIGNNAFRNATALTSIAIPSSVTRVGNSAFSDATSLASVTFAQASQLTSIGESAFDGATSLASITIPSSVTSIGEYAFYETALTSVTIPAGVTSIDYAAFQDASALMDVTFMGNAPTSVSSDVFDGVATGAKAHIKTNASGFGTGSTWKGLFVHADLHEVTYSAGSGSAVSSGVYIEGRTIQTAPVSTRAGYTLSGWSVTANGSVVSFPYAPGVTTDITLYAIWKSNAVKATYVSGVKLTGKTKVGQTITSSPGKWNGTAPISYKYQWYSCKAASTKVLTTGKVAPKCTVIKRATNAAFKITTNEKATYLAVLLTGTNRTGKSTIFTATLGKVS